MTYFMTVINFSVHNPNYYDSLTVSLNKNYLPKMDLYEDDNLSEKF